MNRKMLEDYHARKLCNQTLKEIHSLEVEKVKRFSKLPSVKKYIKTLESIIQDEEDILNSIHAALEGMEDPLYKKLLISKYIECKDQDKIAEEESYSYHYISRLLKKAVTNFELEKRDLF